ncbi:SHOCT-like domain-containing protein [Streptomyces sp. NPDC017979]|uniref:SHOCT-like domain-containing protein n=1 Tax=Streptomyces sp. NPDC017979 TaxID=3365024 RepID=UPI0037876AE6
MSTSTGTSTGTAANEQRRQVLEMLADGKITADEAGRLIDALERQQPTPPQGAPSAPKDRRPKYLRVVVHSDEPGGDGPSRINVRIPLQLLRAGVRLASLIPPQALTKVNEQLHRSGVPIDLAELKPQHLEELVEHLDDIHVNVDDPDSTVQVFCE